MGPFKISLHLWMLAACISTANSTCECGYQTNTGEIWQYSLTTDFKNISNSSFFESNDWNISSIIRAAGDTHPVAINYTPANVAVTNQTLILKCSAYNASSDTGVNSAEIQTTRQDILYGSFRAKYTVGGGSGAIGALFFYANDTQEADIETLTRDDPQSVHFTNQPSSTTQMDLPDGLVRSDFATYRLDWMMNVTNFYVNDILSNNFTTDVPNVNGSVYMNMWSNGGSLAGSPPTTDALLTVQSIQLYFNTSDTVLSTTWEQSCQNKASLPCSVDSEVGSANSTNARSASSTNAGTANSTNTGSGSSTTATTKRSQAGRRAEAFAGKRLAMAITILFHCSAYVF